MSIAAYQARSQAIETPLELEHRAFAEMTRRLIDAEREGATAKQRMEALFGNLRLWVTLLADMAEDGNQLPGDVKGRLCSIAIWVEKYTNQVRRTHETLQPLIDVNREIAAGLTAALATTRAPVTASGGALEARP